MVFQGSRLVFHVCDNDSGDDDDDDGDDDDGDGDDGDDGGDLLTAGEAPTWVPSYPAPKLINL